jgi:hypothetical protein
VAVEGIARRPWQALSTGKLVVSEIMPVDIKRSLCKIILGRDKKVERQMERCCWEVLNQNAVDGWISQHTGPRHPETLDQRGSKSAE